MDFGGVKNENVTKRISITLTLSPHDIMTYVY